MFSKNQSDDHSNFDGQHGMQPKTLPTSAMSYDQLKLPIPNSLPVEIVIYGVLEPGQASREMAASHAKQLHHPTYTDLFFEASAKICNTDFAQGEKTAIYTFLVGKHDLEFHRHEGHRVIIGTVGSGGAYLRFSHATSDEEKADPINFLKKMLIVEMPPDCRFVLRFNGQVYHQFGPKDPNFDAIYAISVHTDEAGGLMGALLEQILNNGGSIPILTEPLSQNTQEVLKNEQLVKKYAEFHSMVSTERTPMPKFPQEWCQS